MRGRKIVREKNTEKKLMENLRERQTGLDRKTEKEGNGGRGQRWTGKVGTLVCLLFVSLSSKRDGMETAKSTDELGEMGKVLHEGASSFSKILFKEISRPLATLGAPG